MSRSNGLAFGRSLLGPIEFSDMTGGIVTAFPPHSLKDNEVADAMNALFEKRGFSKWPGYLGIAATALFPGPVRGSFVYKKTDGTEAYIVVSSRHVYSIDLVAGTKTDLGTLAADTECFAVNYFGKLWIVNGTDAVKIENNLAMYRIGIVPPAGFTLGAANAIAGTFSAGAYDVDLTYTRQISGTNVLDSAPFHAGSVTLDGSHGIRIVTTASADPQVTHITAWITDAGETSTYYYMGITANATGNFDIANANNKSTSLLMYEQVASNQVPSSLAGIYSFGGRLWGLKANDNQAYYCQMAQNVYDLEKWATAFHIPTIPFTIYSYHGIGSDLYANTAGGMYRIPNGDTTAKPQPVTQGAVTNTQLFNFPKSNVKSVVEYNNGLFGMTNDGFRVFDGNSFSIDLTKNIKPQIDIMMASAANFPPAGIIYRRSGKRTEYHVSYNDASISTTNHNRKLVVNVDKLVFNNYFNKDYVTENDRFEAPWEFVQGGFSHAFVTAANNLYLAQDTATAGTIVREAGTTDNYCIDETGAFITVAVPRNVFVKTRTIINELAGIDVWQRIYALAQCGSPIQGQLVIPDQYQYMTGYEFASTGGASPPILDVTPVVLDDPTTTPFVLPADNPLTEFKKMPAKAKGNAMYLVLTQIADDYRFFLFALQAYCYHEKNAFT